jgi:DNA-binding GntR family transcriptional regulator
VYVQIVEALAADIDRGELARGARLPTQRALAEAVGVGIGTVTRAYAEAESRGLIDAVVGRGSFVARSPPAPETDALIDLSRNVAPIAPATAAASGVRSANATARSAYVRALAANTPAIVGGRSR